MIRRSDEEKSKEPEKCANCRFWQTAVGPSSIGICRRFPPLRKRSRFPLTSRDLWCGEYQPISDEVKLDREDDDEDQLTPRRAA